MLGDVLKGRLVLVRAHGALTEHELAICPAASQVTALLVRSSALANLYRETAGNHANMMRKNFVSKE